MLAIFPLSTRLGFFCATITTKAKCSTPMLLSLLCGTLRLLLVCREPEILKSILLRVNRGEYFALALMSGVNRVEAKKLKKILCASHVCFADPDTCREWFGFSPGGVPPVGYSEQPRTLLDEDLFMYDTVWAAAGTDHDFFPVSPGELQRLTQGQRADIKKI